MPSRGLPGPHGSDFFEQPRQASLHSLSDLLDIDQRHIPDAPLNAAVVRPVQSAALGSLFLIDPLLLPHTADRTAKPNADIEQQPRRARAQNLRGGP